MQSLYQIYIEIKKKTFFKENFKTIKQNSILLENIHNSSYTVIDVLFDIYYLKKNFKKKFISIALISIILALALFWVPTLYVAILICANILN